MRSLRGTRAIILKTDCRENMVNGWACSEPILTKDENGALIDNYFAFGADPFGKSYSSPIVVFGIYTDEAKTAYNNVLPKSEVKRIEMGDDYIVDRKAEKKAYDRFEELFPAVRECTYSDNCTDEQKAMVKEYVSCLEKFSGPVVWKYYLELFPSFFEWADSLG